MTPHIVTPEEAQERINSYQGFHFVGEDLAYTVATEPDRTRAAVVQALRDVADYTEAFPRSGPARLRQRADAIENGADL